MTTESEQNDADGQVMFIGNHAVNMNADEREICAKIQLAFTDYTCRWHPPSNGFAFGQASHDNLAGVYPPLVLIVGNALTFTTQDFGVTCGLRNTADQSKAVAQGMSRTMHSLHLPQKDGYSHAVDLVPWIGHFAWDWNRIYDIAVAMHRASSISGVSDKIRWGGAWDRRLADFGDTPKDFQDGVKAYAIRHQGSDLLDGPHFEWVVE